MQRDEVVRRLDAVRLQLQELLLAAPSPAVERLIQDADINFHTALWLLGEVRGLTPEGQAPAAGVRD